MATLKEYGAIASLISIAIIGVVKSNDIKEHFFPDPVKARYELIDRKCAQPTPDGSRRQIVYLDDEKTNHGYVPCPRKD